MNMKLVLPPVYVKEATELINAAQHRVAVIAMVIADHPATHTLIEALIEAANRGVTVHVAADIFTYGEVSGSFLPLRYDHKGSRAATSMARRLKAAGVTFHWLGRGRITLFNGRTHSKWCVVDDTVFAFGGVNLYQDGIESTDYMFKVHDASLATTLYEEQLRIQRVERSAQNYASHHRSFDTFNALFDGGIIGQSVIYRRVCQLAESAIDITYVSQYCPTGKLARILRSKPYRIYFNRPEQATALNKILLYFSRAVSGLRTDYTRDNYLHAKYIIFTHADGSKTAISGSHNFAYTGVLFGTREVALETKDPAIIRQLESFTERWVA
jgi:cardiolipin synthase A/B